MTNDRQFLQAAAMSRAEFDSQFPPNKHPFVYGWRFNEIVKLVPMIKLPPLQYKNSRWFKITNSHIRNLFQTVLRVTTHSFQQYRGNIKTLEVKTFQPRMAANFSWIGIVEERSCEVTCIAKFAYVVKVQHPKVMATFFCELWFMTINEHLRKWHEKIAFSTLHRWFFFARQLHSICLSELQPLTVSGQKNLGNNFLLSGPCCVFVLDLWCHVGENFTIVFLISVVEGANAETYEEEAHATVVVGQRGNCLG